MMNQLSMLLLLLLSYISISHAWTQLPPSLVSVNRRNHDIFQQQQLESSNLINSAASRTAAAVSPALANIRSATTGTTSTQHSLMSQTAASLLAGSVAGAIGVGVAFPLDTLKTKSQVMDKSNRGNMFSVVAYIWDTEGINGFFQGVGTMMFGQALIKALAFAANTFGLTYLAASNFSLSNSAQLLSAACFAGFLTSFLVVPFERVKVMMQAAQKGQYENAGACLSAVLRSEGVGGLMGRGLGTTLAREVPSYGIYFFVSGFLMQSALAVRLGGAAPLLFGALAGCACWIPVYPLDVVKTLVQNTEGGESVASWDVAKNLYAEEGVSGFFDGLTPKMLRAAVNHSVTFFVYDLIFTAIFQSR